MASSDRIKLSTAVTTIVRAPLSKAKSGVWAALGGKSRLDLQPPDSTGAPAYGGPAPGAASGPAWLVAGGGAPISGGALTADIFPASRTSTIDHLAHPLTAAVTAGQPPAAPSPAAGPSLRRVPAGPSSKTLLPSRHSGGGIVPAITGGGGPGGAAGIAGPGGYANGFRRSGIASAPNDSGSRPSAHVLVGGVSSSGVDAAERGARLPAIGGGARAPAARADSPPADIGGQPSRRTLLALPSIAVAALAAADEDTPVVVSFLPPRAPANGRAALRGASRPGRALAAAVASAAAAGDDEDEDSASSASTSMPGQLAPAARPAPGALRGASRFFGKDITDPGSVASGPGGGSGGGTFPGGSTGGGGAPASRQAPYEDSDSQDSGTATAAQSASSAIAQLASKHKREQERVNRVRYAVLGDAGAKVDAVARVDVAPAAARGGGGMGSEDDVSSPGAVPSPKIAKLQDADEPHMLPEARSLRSGKSFTQRALEDPQNPMFKSAKQLAAVQEKLSYMEDRSWREKAAESVPMERPILMAEGWKV